MKENTFINEYETGDLSSFEEKDYTLIFLRKTIDNNKSILLGMKLRGFGIGKWNGFGGKIEAGETIEEGAIREVHEECGIKVISLVRIGYLVFKMKLEEKNTLTPDFRDSIMRFLQFFHLFKRTNSDFFFYIHVLFSFYHFNQ